MAKKRHQQTINSAAKRRAQLNDLISELGTSLAAPKSGQIDESQRRPRKCKRLPQQLSSRVESDPSSFETLWRHSKVGLFVADRSMEALDANPFLLEKLGYAPYEVRNLWNIVHLDSLKMAYREVGKITLGQQKYARLQGRVMHKDGSYQWWHG